MTTKWQPEGLFTGQTVAVLASGASLTQERAESVRDLPCIAVRRAYRRAPWADLLVALDGPVDAGFWEESKDFTGLRICGYDCDVDAHYITMPHDRVQVDQWTTIEFLNNGTSAIRIAARAGASKILLLGFDPPVDGHFVPFFEGEAGCGGDQCYPHLMLALDGLIAELRAQGIEVERVDG